MTGLLLAVWLAAAAPRYTIDFERHFYATPAEAAAAGRRIDALVHELAPSTRELAPSTRELGPSTRELASTNDPERMLAAYESLLVAVNRHDAYLTLRYATNTTDEAAREESRALDAKFEKADTAVRRALAALPEAALQRPALRPYAYFIRTSRELYSKTPTCETPADTWQSDLRDLALGNAQKRDLVAFALIRLAAARNAAAKAHGFPDAVTEAYARSGWTRARVDALLEQLAERAPLYQRFQKLHAAMSPDAPKPQFTIEEARELLPEVLGPLGTSYKTELAKLLDPAERRLDILPGPNRRRGGFSLFTGTNSVFFMSGFGGSYNDLRVLTHESTHAMQRQLMARHGVRPVYRDGPKYLFEATAIFNELLLPDALARRATDPRLRAFYLDQFLAGKGIAVIYTAAAEAALEQAVYDGVARGEITKADDLDALTLKVMGRYAEWPAARWMEIPLMYEDPFYDLNYVWAGLVALNAFARYERDPAATARGYIALLENGFDKPAADLLRQHLGIDVAAPSLVDDALAVTKARIDALEASAALN